MDFCTLPSFPVLLQNHAILERTTPSACVYVYACVGVCVCVWVWVCARVFACVCSITRSAKRYQLLAGNSRDYSTRRWKLKKLLKRRGQRHRSPIQDTSCDIVDHLRGSFGPFSPKSENKSRKGFLGPLGRGGPKSQKKVETELKKEKLEKELIFNSFQTFWASGAKRRREPLSDFGPKGPNEPCKMFNNIARYAPDIT